MNKTEQIENNLGIRERYDDYEVERIGDILSKGIPRGDIKYRPAGGGQRVGYIEGYRVVEYCNDIFGFNGWSFSLLSSTTDVMDERNGAYTVGLSTVVQVTLKDGTFRQDIGYGSMENSKSKVAAFEKAKKEAVTDGLKRCLRLFGYRLGGCVYDKGFLAGKHDSSVRHHARPEYSDKPKIPSKSIDSYRINHQPGCSQLLAIKAEANFNGIESSSNHCNAFPNQPNLPSTSNGISNPTGYNNAPQVAITNRPGFPNPNVNGLQNNSSHNQSSHNPYAAKNPTSSSGLPNSNQHPSFSNAAIHGSNGGFPSRSATFDPFSSNQPTNGIVAPTPTNSITFPNTVAQPVEAVGSSRTSLNPNNPITKRESSPILASKLFGSKPNAPVPQNLSVNQIELKANGVEATEDPLLCDVKDPVDPIFQLDDDYDYEGIYDSTPEPVQSSAQPAPLPAPTATLVPESKLQPQVSNPQPTSTLTNSAPITFSSNPQPEFRGFKTVTNPNTGFTTFSTNLNLNPNLDPNPNAVRPYPPPGQRCSPRLQNLRAHQPHQVGKPKSREGSHLNSNPTNFNSNCFNRKWSNGEGR